MAHNLEISEDGSQVAFALRGAPAWHGLADRIFGEDEIVSTSDMLKAAHLSDWNVRLEQVSTLTPDTYRFVTEPWLVLRTNPFDQGTDVLATVGERYQEVQNEELFSFGDNILDADASWESAGSIKDGRVVFGSLLMPREVVIDPQGANDKTVTYLLVTTSHDGSLAVQACVTPVRVVCQNTLNAALHGVKQSFKIRHTQTVTGKVEQARSALGLTYKYMDAFEAEAQALYTQSITDDTFDKIVRALYPEPEADVKGAAKKWQTKVDLISDLYHTSPTTETIRGTAWGAYNALTERIDYFRSARKGNTANLAISASGFDPVINAQKNQILSAVKELAFA